MDYRLVSVSAAALLAAFLSPLGAQQLRKDSGEPPNASKEAIHARLGALAGEIDALRASHAPQHRIDPLAAEYARLSAALGGDEPVSASGPPMTTTATSLTLPVVGPSCSLPTTNGSFAGTTGAINAPIAYQGVTFTATVSGVGTYLWDLDLNTAITHPNSADLDITLESPAGTIVTITTDNGGTFDNVFNGTLWNDNANAPATDHVYANLTTATPLSPEGRLTAFRGENPNGTWRLRVYDDATGNSGTMNSWSLDVATLASAPTPTTSSFTSSPGTVIPTTAPPNIFTDSIVVAGQGTYLSKVTAYVEITHTFGGDLDITLTSPAGTVVTLTTDNGGANDNTFNGTTFDDDVTDPATDHVYANLTVATPLGPEGATDNFLGQDPNGSWTLTVSDDANADGGTWVRWDLGITTIAAPSPSAASNFAGTTGAIPDFSSGVTVVPTLYTANVSGLPTELWDVDLTTMITHTASADLDMTLTSPAGTVVVISTDNGGTFDNTFDGTLWDDNANAPASDFTYANLTTATPLSPEGRLTAFRGEDPNGTWTLTIADDAAADNGTVTGWTLDVAALPALPNKSSATLSSTPGTAIPSSGTFTATDTIAVSGLGTSISEIEAYIEITHTFAGDLDITLMSPAGTIVTLTTDNGGAFDNVFNGTTFDGSSADPATDHVYTNLVVVPLLGPEGSLDNFAGQDPNGTWTMSVTDDANLDGGTWVRWDLTVRTCAAPPMTLFCFGDGSGTACPCSNNSLPADQVGCLNSFGVGARLRATGNASIASDTVVLTADNLPAASTLFFQGTNQQGAGAGSVFGDGLRCAGGTIIRLHTHTAQGAPGSAVTSYPSSGPDHSGPADLSVSARGLVTSPGTRTYQAWYRNSAPFCTAAVFNLSNGLEIPWQS